MECDHCRTTVDPDARRCPSCGAEFVDDGSIFDHIPAGVLGVGVGGVSFAVLGATGATDAATTLGVGAAVALAVWIGAEVAG